MSLAETWRSIPGYEGAYEVSSLGRVASLDRVTDRGRRWKGRLMSPSQRSDGYLTVTLWKDGHQGSSLIHRLVLLVFAGPPRENQEALHADGDRSNNAISNLSWGSHSDNQWDQIRHGRHYQSSKTHCEQGHPFTPENTYHYPSRTHKACRTCRRKWAREGAARRRASERKAV